MVNASGKNDSGVDSQLAATSKIFQAIQGHWLSASLGVIMQLKVPEILAAQEGPMEFTKLAAEAQVKPAGHDHFYKVLRMLAQWELLDESEGRNFTANLATKQLVRGKEATLGHFVDHQINKPKWEAWKFLPEAVQQGDVAFALAHGGSDMHQYDEEEGHEAFADDFQNAMTSFTRLSLTGGEVPLKDAYDWSKSKCMMDVGGGRGEMLASCMSYGSDSVKGILMDRPWVLDSVSFEGTFESKGIKNAKERTQLVAAEVREPWPQAVKDANVDTMMMKHFLSGFSDDDAKTILRHISDIQNPGSHILLFQTLVPEAGDRSHNVNRDGVAPGVFAIEILAMCPGGGWRTLSEWKILFGTQKYELIDLKEVGASMHLMVWEKK
jgi:hypothetical protein